MVLGLGREKKNKKKEEAAKPAVSEPSSTHTFTKNFEIQTLSLQEAMRHQREMTNIKREELRELNNRFDTEVAARKQRVEEVSSLQNKVAILQSRVKGLEMQFDTEKHKGGQGTAEPSSPAMMTIRSVHEYSPVSIPIEVRPKRVKRLQQSRSSRNSVILSGPMATNTSPDPRLFSK